MSKHAEVYALPIRVYFQDTDAAGVVHHASYVNFLERARTEWMRDRCGYSNGGLLNEFNVAFVVRSLKLDYLKPALLDDLLSVTVQIKEFGRSRVVFWQNVMRDKEILLETEVQIVCVSMTNLKPVSVPEVLRNQWKA